MLQPGDLVDGYRVLGAAGAGAMSLVFAVSPSDSPTETLALKLLRPELRDRLDLVVRFVNEALPVRHLRHPGVVRVYACEVPAGGLPYQILEYLPETLAQRLQRQPPDRATVLNLTAQLAAALAFLHDNGIIHRDVKPANVLLIDGIAKLGDFGFAKTRDAAGATLPFSSMEGDRFGTPEYMSPEQWLDAKSVGPAADVYSLGVLLYELLTGAPPFRGTDAELRSQHFLVAPQPLPVEGGGAALSTLVQRMLDKSPRRRPPPAEVAGCLRGLERSLPRPTKVRSR